MWKTRRAGEIVLLQAGVLREISWLVHGFTTRSGLTRWDWPAAREENRRRIAQAAGAAEMRPVWLRQVHSDLVQVAGAQTESCCGDALATGQAGLLLCIQTADCVPILLADRRRRAIAAVHAGWRGTLQRIAAKTVGRMRAEFGTRPEDVSAAIGPSIGRCCYQVGPEVAQQFAGQFAEAAEWFEGPFARVAENTEPNPLPWLNRMPPGHQPEPERLNLDLRAANCRQLEEAGVSRRRMAVSELCTKCRQDLFFSYRRDGAGTGRMLAVIGMKGK